MDNHPFWKHEDKVGYRPRKPIECPHCEEVMVMRHSSCHASGHVYDAYKCPECDRFIRFVPSFACGDDVDYMKKLWKERGERSFLVPIDEWVENEKIKKKLESLGYW